MFSHSSQKLILHHLSQNTQLIKNHSLLHMSIFSPSDSIHGICWRHRTIEMHPGLSAISDISGETSEPRSARGAETSGTSVCQPVSVSGRYRRVDRAITVFISCLRHQFAVEWSLRRWRDQHKNRSPLSRTPTYREGKGELGVCWIAGLAYVRLINSGKYEY